MKVFEKKFQSPGYPLTLFIATKLPESTPSRKNLSPKPGVKNLVGSAADDNLMIPELAPLKIPVYGLSP